MKLSIVHFQPIEKYPPLMNLVRVFYTNNIELDIYSTSTGNNWFTLNNVRIFRLAKLHFSSSKRYFGYIVFNFHTLFKLLQSKPKNILVYETYSVWPVRQYLRIFKDTNVYVHYHEYLSTAEIRNASLYYKYLLKIEDEILKKARWVSHTNEDRIKLFHKDKPFIPSDKLFVFPNYPLKHWAVVTQKKVKPALLQKTKLVYVGALGLDTTYIAEICEWVKNNESNYSLEIYSDNIETETMSFLRKFDPSVVRVVGKVKYFRLPEILAKYHVGLVLYKGHIPNYIYNLPNKVMEYLHCHLAVWYPKSLITTDNWAQENKRSVNFSPNLPKEFNVIKSEESDTFRFCAESAVRPLLDVILGCN